MHSLLRHQNKDYREPPHACSPKWSVECSKTPQAYPSRGNAEASPRRSVLHVTGNVTLMCGMKKTWSTKAWKKEVPSMKYWARLRCSKGESFGSETLDKEAPRVLVIAVFSLYRVHPTLFPGIDHPLPLLKNHLGH